MYWFFNSFMRCLVDYKFIIIDNEYILEDTINNDNNVILKQLKDNLTK